MAWKNFGNSSLQVQEQWPDDEDDEEEEEEMERAGTALTLSCWSHPVLHLVLTFS